MKYWGGGGNLAMNLVVLVCIFCCFFTFFIRSIDDEGNLNDID